MMKILFFSYLLCSAWAAVAAAQGDSLSAPSNHAFVIDTIIISGNVKTEPYVILDEMSLKPGMVATPELIDFDKNRIYSLGLFTRVEIFADTLQGKHFLLVDVSERWYLIPLLSAGFRDGDPKKPYLGGGLLVNNFRGRNQRLTGLAIFGYDPSLGFGFHDPLIGRDPSLYFSTNISFSRVRNKSQIESAITGDFNEEHYDINTTIGHRFNLFETAAVTLGFSIIKVPEYRPGRTVSPTGRDAYLYGTLGYARDTRDLREYPSDGSLLSLYINKNGFGETDLSFTRIGVDMRKYIPLPSDFVVAGRVYSTIVAGHVIPTHSRSYLGYGERIRGYFKDVFEGEDLMGASVEFHWPLLKTRVINFTAISIPKEFSIWRFGISLALFADAGTVWFRNQPITIGSFVSGYGGGIHFLLPYSAIMRTEYAWNNFGKGQFILDFRTSI